MGSRPRRIVCPPTSPRQTARWSGVFERYCNEQSHGGLEGGEGSFIACGFWLAHVKLLQGQRDEAERRVRRLLSVANDLGLLSEEYDVSARRQCGNFPQALSHVALINTLMAMGA